MSADPGFMVLLSASMFCGALIASLAGFAFAPVAAILLIPVLEPMTLVPLLMICSVLVQLAGLVRRRRRIAWAHSDAMLLGGAGGIPLAVLLLPAIDAWVFQIGFGAFLLAYAALMLGRPMRRTVRPPDPRRELAVGFCGGLVGGLTAMPGAIPALYCDLNGQSRARRRAIVQPYALAMQLLALAMLAIGGGFPAALAWHVLAALPALALGTAIGLALFGRMPNIGYRRTVLVAALATGIGAIAGSQILGTSPAHGLVTPAAGDSIRH